MIKEIYYFFRYGPKILKRRKELGPAEFLKEMAEKLDADGYDELRKRLIGDLEGDVLEIGAGTGATFPYYGPKVKVTAIEPNEELRAAAEEAAKGAKVGIRVLPGFGEELPFADAAFDAVSASKVLCSVALPLNTFAGIQESARPGGQIRLLEHVRSEHWLAGPLMVLLNPVWLRINKVGCNWDRKTVESVQDSGFTMRSIESYKIYSEASPAAFPIRIIKAVRSADIAPSNR